MVISISNIFSTWKIGWEIFCCKNFRITTCYRCSNRWCFKCIFNKRRIWILIIWWWRNIIYSYQCGWYWRIMVICVFFILWWQSSSHSKWKWLNIIEWTQCQSQLTIRIIFLISWLIWRCEIILRLIYISVIKCWLKCIYWNTSRSHRICIQL